MSALCYFQIAMGGPRLSLGRLPRLTYVLRGVRRAQVARSPRQRLPITPALLSALREVWSPDSCRYTSVMLWAASCLAFFAFLRSGEFTCSSMASFSLAPGDIRVDSHADPQVLEVHLRVSKTDPFGKGSSIFMGRTHADVCPVTAMLGYLALRPSVPGPLFIYEDGSPLSRTRFVRAVRLALQKIGVDASLYGGHSFRIGAATTAAHLGLGDALIQALGRWKSDAYMSYIPASPDYLASASVSLVHSPQ